MRRRARIRATRGTRARAPAIASARSLRSKPVRAERPRELHRAAQRDPRELQLPPPPPARPSEPASPRGRRPTRRTTRAARARSPAAPAARAPDARAARPASASTRSAGTRRIPALLVSRERAEHRDAFPPVVARGPERQHRQEQEQRLRVGSQEEERRGEDRRHHDRPPRDPLPEGLGREGEQRQQRSEEREVRHEDRRDDVVAGQDPRHGRTVSGYSGKNAALASSVDQPRSARRRYQTASCRSVASSALCQPDVAAGPGRPGTSTGRAVRAARPRSPTPGTGRSARRGTRPGTAGGRRRRRRSVTRADRDRAGGPSIGSRRLGSRTHATTHHTSTAARTTTATSNTHCGSPPTPVSSPKNENRVRKTARSAASNARKRRGPGSTRTSHGRSHRLNWGE